MGGQRTKFEVKKDNNDFGMSGWRKKNVVVWKNEQQ